MGISIFKVHDPSYAKQTIGALEALELACHSHLACISATALV